MACAFCLAILAVRDRRRATMGMGMRPPMPMGIFTNPAVGAGAQYDEIDSLGRRQDHDRVRRSSAKRPSTARTATGSNWTTSGGRMGEMVMKTLVVPGATNGVSTPHMIMQMGKGIRPPMEILAPPMMPHGQCGAEAEPGCRGEGGQDLGKESVTVPAGTLQLRALPLERRAATDTWVSSPGPAPFGMVKSVNSGSTRWCSLKVDQRRTRQNRRHASAVQSRR